MAFEAELKAVQQSGTTIGVDVEYRDAVASFSVMHHLDFHDTVALTAASLRAEVIRVGEQYKNALTKTQAIGGQVGTVIVI